VRLKQTAMTPRNRSNIPDSFERAALQEFADPSYPKEKVISEVTAASQSLRLMFPLYATRGCLDCHGEPKGERDKTGYAKEGLRLGQNAGAISVVIPAQR
jgi:general secretion pathway protein A